MILVAVELLSSDPDRVSISEEPPRPAVLDGKPKKTILFDDDSTRSCFDLTCILHGKKINVCQCEAVKNLCQYAHTC